MGPPPISPIRSSFEERGWGRGGVYLRYSETVGIKKGKLMFNRFVNGVIEIYAKIKRKRKKIIKKEKKGKNEKRKIELKKKIKVEKISTVYGS